MLSKYEHLCILSAQYNTYIQDNIAHWVIIASLLLPDELLLQFFHFYATADFNLGICIKNGIIDRTDTRPIFIENPVELDRNAAKTVEKNMLDKFQDCCRDSHAKLEKEMALGKYSTSDWGMLCILRKSRNDEKESVIVKR